MSDSQKIAREIVERILDTPPADFCPFPRLAAIREEWVALVTQVIEEHMWAIIHATEKENARLSDAFLQEQQRAQAAEKERDEAVANCAQLDALLREHDGSKAESERLTQRVRELEEGLRQIAMGTPYPGRSGEVEWARAVSIAQETLLSQPPAPQPSQFEPPCKVCGHDSAEGHEANAEGNDCWGCLECLRAAADKEEARRHGTAQPSEPASPTTTPEKRCTVQVPVEGLYEDDVIGGSKQDCGNPLPCNLHPEGSK